MSIGPSIHEIQHFQNLTLKIQDQGQMTMTLHNYRSRQFHRTSNGINPSSGFRDMGSAMSGPSGTNGQITMALHNYRSRQVHKTLNGANQSSSFRDMRSAKSGPNLWEIWQVFGPWASPYGANGQMNMTVHNYRPRQFLRTSNGENPSSGYRDMGSASLAAARPAARPPARPPEPWRQYPSSPKGWGVKSHSKWVFVFIPHLKSEYSPLIVSKLSRKSAICPRRSPWRLIVLVRSLRSARLDIAWLVKSVTYFILIG